MQVKVTPSSLRGKLEPPSSKSVTHRALVCSALAQGESAIRRPLISDDTVATRRLIELLGPEVSGGDEEWRVKGGALTEPFAELDCGESGTTIRLMTAVCSLVEGVCKLTGGPSLSRRPMEPLVEGLKQLGVNVDSTGGRPPVLVRGNGRIRGGEASIRGDISSQFISALLLVAPRGEKPTTLSITTPLESKPYVSITMDTQKLFGVNVEASEDMTEFKVKRQDYTPTEMTVEGDWSSAAFLLAAGAMTGGVSLGNLNMSSRQADKAIVDALKAMGGEIQDGDSSIEVREAHLRGFTMNVSDSPDIFPVLAALGATASGTSTLTGWRRLRYKESDRIEAMAEGLRKMGIQTALDGDTFTVKGGKPRGAAINPHQDHRIAMAFTILGLVADGETTINNAECVTKSYPGFWDDMEALGVDIRRIED